MTQATLERWRPAMMRFALLHLQPREEAEDAVQDALLAALAAPARNLADDARHYLFGILKHKVTDRLRQRYRHGRPPDQEAAQDQALDALLFDPSGHWAVGMSPPQWATPEGWLASEQFFVVVDACVQRLPRKASQVFSMKELLECEPDEICATLGLSKSDYWQCMSRARKQLQLCLTDHWFGQTR